MTNSNNDFLFKGSNGIAKRFQKQYQIRIWIYYEILLFLLWKIIGRKYNKVFISRTEKKKAHSPVSLQRFFRRVDEKTTKLFPENQLVWIWCHKFVQAYYCSFNSFLMWGSATSLQIFSHDSKNRKSKSEIILNVI